MAVPLSFFFKGLHEVTFHLEESFNSVGGILIAFSWCPIQEGKPDSRPVLLNIIFDDFAPQKLNNYAAISGAAFSPTTDFGFVHIVCGVVPPPAS